MRRGIALRPDYDAAQLRALAKASRNAGQSRRLLALAEIYDGGSRTKAARIGGVGLQSVRDWVVRFNAHGPDGLIDGKAPGNSRKLNDSQRQALVNIVESGPMPAIHGVVRWRLKDLTLWIWEEFQISLSETTLSRELRSLGYRKLSARPRHYAQDPEAQEVFKKASRPNWRRSGRASRTARVQAGRRNTLREEVAMTVRKRRSDRSGEARCPRLVGPLLRGVRITVSSGLPSRRDARVRTPRLGPGCRQPWGHGGSGGRAACHHHISRRRRSRCPGALCRLPSGGDRDLARTTAWGARDRPPAQARAVHDLARAAPQRCHAQRRSGVPSHDRAWHADRSARRPKSAKLAINEPLRRYVQDRLAGMVVAPNGAAVHGPIVPWKGRRHGRRQDRRAGLPPGARNRSPAACGSTSLTMRPCASATKPSTKRCTCKAGRALRLRTM